MLVRRTAQSASRFLFPNTKCCSLPREFSSISNTDISSTSSGFLHEPSLLGGVRSSFGQHEENVYETQNTYPFDTHKFVKRLEESGLTKQQAEAISSEFLQTISLALLNNEKRTVTKAQQEIFSEQVMSHLSSLKKDMVILEKSEFAALRAGNEKLELQLAQATSHFRDVMDKLQGQISLEITLQKSLSKEMKLEVDDKIHHLKSALEMNTAKSDTKFETYRNDVYKSSITAVLSCLTIALGFYRLWIR